MFMYMYIHVYYYKMKDTQSQINLTLCTLSVSSVFTILQCKQLCFVFHIHQYYDYTLSLHCALNGYLHYTYRALVAEQCCSFQSGLCLSPSLSDGLVLARFVCSYGMVKTRPSHSLKIECNTYRHIPFSRALHQIKQLAYQQHPL